MSVRVAHTSDLHIGKKVYKTDLLEFQSQFLKEFPRKLKNNQIDILLICGDIFDVPNPSHSSVQVFFNFLKELSSLDIKCFIINGNHDSSTLVQLADSLVDKNKIKIISNLKDIKNLNELNTFIELKNEKIKIAQIPFFRPHEVVRFIEKNQDNTPEKIAESFIKKISVYTEGFVNITMAHHLYGNFEFGGSENALFMSGIENIRIGNNSYDYLALGHIHRPQICKKEPLAAYSGSPYPLHFGEDNKKSYSLIEIENGAFTQQMVPLNSYFNLRQIKITDIFNEALMDEYLIEDSVNNLVEVIVELKNFNSTIYDEVKEYFSTKKSKLISIKTVNQKRNTNEKINVSAIPSIYELFETFIDSKIDNNPKKEEIIKESFNQIISSIKLDTESDYILNELKTLISKEESIENDLELH